MEKITFDYSLKEAREIAKQYFGGEVPRSYNENIIGGHVPGAALNYLCEKMLSAINDDGIDDNTPAGDE